MGKPLSTMDGSTLEVDDTAMILSLFWQVMIHQYNNWVF